MIQSRVMPEQQQTHAQANKRWNKIKTETDRLNKKTKSSTRSRLRLWILPPHCNGSAAGGGLLLALACPHFGAPGRTIISSYREHAAVCSSCSYHTEDSSYFVYIINYIKAKGFCLCSIFLHRRCSLPSNQFSSRGLCYNVLFLFLFWNSWILDCSFRRSNSVIS
jgi:hypothetical protein